ncbi:MarR family winged helix-turn-helix transcriptional regulator [Paramicrobacterium agarici]|uniref:DNA-binding MarR family transcriptional regulator n=1 Tax=Paramicrobacterium agarici TaxID=630514 RepID=A0A2A9DSE5_9MICO|nr:MarR family transcriptional regulator [Microbacterium agarici]PFG29598.1 DNA-binding MarR family transcriptional regulator [Microbacterium agarici]
MNASKAQEPVDAAAYRRYLAALTLFHEAAADSVGLAGVDYQASNLLGLDGPMPSSELARRLGLSLAATSRLVDRLIDAGIARRREDPADRRRAVVEHTGHLPGDLATVLDAVREPIAAALEAMSEEQRSGVERYVTAAAEAYSNAARAVRESA